MNKKTPRIPTFRSESEDADGGSARKGIGYLTLLKMLVPEGLVREDRRG